jgi:hypothetical protein
MFGWFVIFGLNTYPALFNCNTCKIGWIVILSMFTFNRGPSHEQLSWAPHSCVCIDNMEPRIINSTTWLTGCHHNEAIMVFQNMVWICSLDYWRVVLPCEGCVYDRGIYCSSGWIIIIGHGTKIFMMKGQSIMLHIICLSQRCSTSGYASHHVPWWIPFWPMS